MSEIRELEKVSSKEFPSKDLTYVQTLRNKVINQPMYALVRGKDRLLYGLEDMARLMLTQHTLSEGVVNSKAIRIIGLRRTGNHAIINWIKKQQVGAVEHLNNIPLYGNPFRWKYMMLRDYAPESFERQKDNIRQQARGNFTRKDCLIYSYEDHPIARITSPTVERKHEFYFGKSLKQYDVLILRDPFNLIASRLENNMLPVKSFTQSIIDLWIEYAREFLGETHCLSNQKVLINYNQWVTDVNYRRKISSQLDLSFTDAGINDVQGYGGGSSFDKRNFAGRATQMDVMGRWKHFANSKLFQEILSNSALLDYSERIFGHIPEVEALIHGRYH